MSFCYKKILGVFTHLRVTTPNIIEPFYLMHFFYNPIFDTISKTKIEGVGSVGERIKSNRFNQNIWGKNTI